MMSLSDAIKNYVEKAIEYSRASHEEDEEGYYRTASKEKEEMELAFENLKDICDIIIEIDDEDGEMIYPLYDKIMDSRGEIKIWKNVNTNS